MTDDEWQAWVRGFRAGDPDVAREFWEKYGALLQQVAAGQMADRLRHRVGPDDVVQSACRTFFRRARAGQVELTDGESLWRLMCAIVLTKVREQARYHGRQRRSMDREVPIAGEGDESGAGIPVAARGPAPDDAAAMADEFGQLLATLDDEERAIVDLKLQECTYEEIAERLGMSDRTARRLFKRVQVKLARVIGAEG